MPKLTINGVPLDPFFTPPGCEQLRSNLTYMLSVVEENQDLNDQLAITFEKLLKVYHTSGDIVKQKEALATCQILFAPLVGISPQQATRISADIFESFVQGAREDAKKALYLGKFIQDILTSETVEWHYLAVFYFTLQNELERMSITPNQSEPEKRMIEKLIATLGKSIVPEGSRLEKLYFFCHSFYSFKANSNIREYCATGLAGTLTISREACQKCFDALDKLGKSYQKIRGNLFDEDFKYLDTCIGEDGRRIFEPKPNCYKLNSDNVFNYPFRTFCFMFDLYHRMKMQILKVKFEQAKPEEPPPESEEDRTLKADLAEIQEGIEKGRQQSLEKRKVSPSVSQEMTLDQKYQSMSTENALIEQKLKGLKPEIFAILYQLFTNKASLTSIRFSDVATLVSNFDGKIEVFDGSKARIYLPSLSSPIPGVVGGFHKPHAKKSPCIGFLQCRSICRAFSKIGINKESVLNEFSLRDQSTPDQRTRARA